MEYYYTDERNAQIMISLLKAHKIKKVVASPGTTNICLISSMQRDPYFKMYSAADERSAAYIACGLSAETKEPVVISCTGATASRNYLPGLTEAYYRKLPIVAITSSRRNYRIGHNIDQVTDRTQLPKDVAKISVQLPLVYDEESEWACIISANKALLELNHNSKGPVHINLETNYSKNYQVKKLPTTRAIYRYKLNDETPDIDAKKVLIMVAAHLEWSNQLTENVDKFCERYNAIVLCDHTSNYKGKYGIQGGLAAQQKDYKSKIFKFDLMIHIGDICGLDYTFDMVEVWRVNPDGELRDTFGKLSNVFEFKEEVFFSLYVDKADDNKLTSFFMECKEEEERIKQSLDKIIMQLPFSNAWVASQTASKLPDNSVLHLGILNSLRFWSFFRIPESVLSFSNTGGFGIDGNLSSTIGASLANKEKIYFCVIGDLAFFYDMNSLGNRHVGNNIRILLVNNGKGTEFKLNSNPGSLFGRDTDKFIAAAGHYGNKSPVIVKHFAEDLGFEYLSASSKGEYLTVIDRFIDSKIGVKPIVLEIFTESENENEAFEKLKVTLIDDKQKMKRKAKGVVRKILGEKGTSTLKKITGDNKSI